MIFKSETLRNVHPEPASRARPGIRQQRGSTLLVGLIMLVLLTLVAVSAINSTTSSVQMVGNAQFREEATSAAQKAIENVISTGDFRSTAPLPQTIVVNGIASYTVTFAPAPVCVSYKPVDPTDPTTPPVCAGNSDTPAMCGWAVWDIRAVVADPATGASVAIHQGVKTLVKAKDAAASC